MNANGIFWGIVAACLVFMVGLLAWMHGEEFGRKRIQTAWQAAEEKAKEKKPVGMREELRINWSEMRGKCNVVTRESFDGLLSQVEKIKGWEKHVLQIRKQLAGDDSEIVYVDRYTHVFMLWDLDRKRKEDARLCKEKEQERPLEEP